MFQNLTEQQVFILWGIAVYLIAFPTVITTAAVAGILGRPRAASGPK
jgi:hypothetical protein